MQTSPTPFALSLSKGISFFLLPRPEATKRFDTLGPNGSGRGG
jgi:hypothetical protein